ncbi:hypothetical protein C8J57DRAFT_1705574 [Mycena rebaudengoi]|nr:hypothetical protein C8J57DRAFT_1705574 [Mycena rebaudengoi]
MIHGYTVLCSLDARAAFPCAQYARAVRPFLCTSMVAAHLMPSALPRLTVVLARFRLSPPPHSSPPLARRCRPRVALPILPPFASSCISTLCFVLRPRPVSPRPHVPTLPSPPLPVSPLLAHPPADLILQFSPSFRSLIHRAVPCSRLVLRRNFKVAIQKNGKTLKAEMLRARNYIKREVRVTDTAFSPPCRAALRATAPRELPGWNFCPPWNSA